MAAYAPDRTVDDIESSQGHNEKDLDPELPDYEAPYADPFGNEEFSEVKYKTMEWWYVDLSVLEVVRSSG